MNRAGRPALLLFAHGARDAAWSKPFEAVVERLRAQAPDLPVRLAFLEFMAPDMESAANDLVRQGATQVTIVPLFLGAGGHVRRDVPPLLARLQSTHPGVRWQLQPSIGEHAAVIDAMAQGALAATTAAATAPADNGPPEPAET